MPRDFHTVDADKSQDVTQNAYYQKIQKELKEKTSAHQQQKQSAQEDPRHATKVTQVEKTNQSHMASVKDKVEIRSTSWDKNKKGEFELKASLSDTFVTSIDLKNDGAAILRSAGQKIDYSSRITQLKQSFMQNVVQSRTGNFFLSKYAQFKVGVTGQLLTWLGLTPQEIEKLSKKALEGAIAENEKLMGENIYNIEITDILYGKSKKVKRSMAMLTQIEQQLTKQMALLGKPDFWNKARIAEEHFKQCKKIEEEFQQERNLLAYQLEYNHG